MKMTNENKEKVITSFRKGISKGPFKHLKESHEENDSNYILKKYHEDNHNEHKNDISIWHLAVEQAWIDVCRTVSGGDKNGKIKAHYGEVIKQLFDQNSKITIQSIIEEDFYNLSVGKKQKLVNMTLKYLFCCKDIRTKPEYDSVFTGYQMPLDSYILCWYNDIFLCWYNDIFKDNKIKTKWSNLTKEEYGTIQNNIHNICQGTDLIYAEFVIWEKEAKIQSNKDLIQCSNTIKKSTNKDMPLHTNLESYIKERNDEKDKLEKYVTDFTRDLQQKQ